MKTLNGYEVVDEKARQDIELLKDKEVDLSNYYNKAETAALVDKAIDNIEIPTVDLTPYATKQFVTDEIAKIEIPEGGGGDADLSNYYTKSEIDSKIHEVNSTSDSRYTVLTTSIETINNAGYQTEAQVASAIKNSRSDYDEWVGVMLDGIESVECGSVKEYVDKKFANIATAEGGSY